MAKVTALKGRAVIGLEHAQKIGTVDGLVIDPGAAQLVGLKINSGQTGAGPLFLPATAIYSVGPDAITVREQGLVQQDATQLGSIASLPDSHELGATKVVTDRGVLLGAITDIVVDDNNLQILGYELDGAGLESLLGKTKFLPAQAGYRYGGDLMLVPDGVVTNVGQGVPPQSMESGTPAPVHNQQDVSPNSAPTVEADAQHPVVVIQPHPNQQAGDQ